MRWCDASQKNQTIRHCCAADAVELSILHDEDASRRTERNWYDFFTLSFIRAVTYRFSGHISLPRTSLILLNTTPHQQLSPDYHSTTKVRLDSIKSRNLPTRTYFDCISSVEKDYCAEPHCQEYLSDFDRASVKWCSKKAFKNETSTVKGDCEFMRGEGRAPVALTSLPGSGNTWIRGLLEKATGICTGEDIIIIYTKDSKLVLFIFSGSIYCDRGLRKEVFDAEGIRSGSVLVVKTHRSRYAWTDINKPQTLQWSKVIIPIHSQV